LHDEFKLADLQLSYDDKLRMEAAAPIVVLGKVTEVKVIGRPHRSQAEPRVWVQLKQIAVQIEETIKGRASDGSLWFYYFSFSEYSEADLGRGW
jgi:hypothetical protein